MESIYYVLSWNCHRKCKHCYEERFRPYVRDELEALVREAEAASPKIIANLPASMIYKDREKPLPERPGAFEQRVGRIILSGGEVLTDPVRERLLYPALEALAARYRDAGGVKLVVQTTGDLVTPAIVADLMQRGVWMISVAGMDDFHVGMEGEKRVPLQEDLVRMFEAAGMRRSGLQAGTRKWHEEEGPLYSFFGATEDAWIGRIWPRGRAWVNDLSRASIADNFCGAWSGGLNFLSHGWSGAEVSVDPTGDVFPCCMKTALPIGNLTEEPLTEILDSLAGHPVYEAINAGKPERMGLTHGWSIEDYMAKSRTKTPGGRDYANLCIGCDAFHKEVLAPVIAKLRADRLAARHGALAA